MLNASFEKYTLLFKRPSGTSRGVLKKKDSWFIKIWDTKSPNIIGTGECGLLRGLSCDDIPNYENKVKQVCQNINDYVDNFHISLIDFPSIRFGVEMALMDLNNGGKQHFFENSFSKRQKGIDINGLIWMGNVDFMQEQIDAKLEQGYHCIKMKIGAINFAKEYNILRQLRKRYSKETIELRVDANGAFSPEEAFVKLDELSKLDIHSIEQPIRQGQWKAMEKLCAVTPLPIALDEELIGVHEVSQRKNMLDTIKPQYIILKPSLVGGWQSSDEWIKLAEDRDIGWWATSALESNIGLNAIAQWTATKSNSMPQGLGTGQLYTNNIESDLIIENGQLFLGKNK
ncbi:MAG: o-succinylbenzoate synthase [Chitinophagales bacterium]